MTIRTELEDAERVQLVTILCDNSTSMDTETRRRAACKALEAAIQVFQQAEKDLRSQSDGTHTLRVSIRWLNGSFLVKDAHPDDLPIVGEGEYGCLGSTPLFERSLEVLKDLNGSVKKFRDEGRKARGHLIWFSDGEANSSPESIKDELKDLVSKSLNPKTSDGRSTTRLLNLFAIPIGENARSFYETVGVPNDLIFDVPDSLAAAFEAKLVEAMRKSSLLAVFGDAPSGTPQGKNGELPGDLFLQLLGNSPRNIRPQKT